ncbi:hypothetical protein ACQJBY_035959 [Aegilops geniculata]
MDDLLGDELTDNANGNKLEKNKKEEEKNNRERENTGGGSTPSLQSNKSANSTSSQNSKQKVSEYLKQLQDPLSMEQSYNILQGMELDEDEDEIEDLLTEDGENLAGDEDEVIFSPHLNPEKTLNSQLTHGETVALPKTKEGKSKWGPVQASRKSNRVEVGGRTMMEIAINTKKVQNLEVSKEETKDMEENARTCQEMADLGRRTCLDKDGDIHSEYLLHPRNSFPNSGRVTDGENNIEGGFNHSLFLSRLKINGAPETEDPSFQTSPPRSPTKNTCKTMLLSPVTPLELGGSPVKPWKKLKSVAVVDTAKETVPREIA